MRVTIILLVKTNLIFSFSLYIDSVSLLWLKFCWIMGRGPMLLHTNTIKLMDNKIKEIAKTRYASEIRKAHEILYVFYVAQPNSIVDRNGKYQWLNINKLIELPYHAYTLISRNDSELNAELQLTSYERSPYLCDLTWIYAKIKATKSVHYVLNDLRLLTSEQIAKWKHLILLQTFLETNIRAISYDADQFYPLLKNFMSKALSSDNELPNDTICSKWIETFNNIPISYLDNLINLEENGRNDAGYDSIVNLGGNGYFVASISMAREEICVWDVSKLVNLSSLSFVI